MKWVKQRAMTVNKQRAIEMALSQRRDRGLQVAGENGEEDFATEDGVMQGLYAEHQTELYRPDPVVDVSEFVPMEPTYSQLLDDAGSHTEERLW